jgi:hypothetical protein
MAKAKLAFVEAYRRGKFRGYLNMAAIERVDFDEEAAENDDDPLYPEDPLVVWVQGKRWVVSAAAFHRGAFVAHV